MTDFIFEWFFFFILPFMLLLKGLKPIWRKTLGPCFNTGLDWLGKQVASLWNTFYATIKEKLSNKQRKEIAEAGNEYDICESGNKRGSESSVTGNHESEYDVTERNATGSNVNASDATGSGGNGSDGNGSDVPGNDVRGIYVTGSSIDRSNVTVSDMDESHVTASDVSRSDVTESNLERLTGSHVSGNAIAGSDICGNTGSDDARSSITISNGEHVYSTTYDDIGSDVTGSVVTGSYGSGSDVTVRDDAGNYGSASGISQTSRSTISETNDRLYN